MLSAYRERLKDLAAIGPDGKGPYGKESEGERRSGQRDRRDKMKRGVKDRAPIPLPSKIAEEAFAERHAELLDKFGGLQGRRIGDSAVEEIRAVLQFKRRLNVPAGPESTQAVKDKMWADLLRRDASTPLADLFKPKEKK